MGSDIGLGSAIKSGANFLGGINQGIRDMGMGQSPITGQYTKSPLEQLASPSPTASQTLAPNHAPQQEDTGLGSIARSGMKAIGDINAGLKAAGMGLPARGSAEEDKLTNDAVAELQKQKMMKK